MVKESTEPQQRLPNCFLPIRLDETLMIREGKLAAAQQDTVNKNEAASRNKAKKGVLDIIKLTNKLYIMKKYENERNMNAGYVKEELIIWSTRGEKNEKYETICSMKVCIKMCYVESKESMVKIFF